MKVYCQCEQLLGEVGPSQVGMKDGRLVWRIRPGWSWRDGALVYQDETFRMERMLAHEVRMESGLSGTALARECDLPLRVQCPKCHLMRWITQDLAFRPAARR